MKCCRLLLVICLFASGAASAQRDTLRFSGLINLQTMMQSGNLNQYGGNMVAKLALSNEHIYTGYSLNYNHVTVEEHNIIDDSWNYGLFRYHHKKTLYPLVMGYHGFAKSFGIDRATVLGLGGGLNIFQRSPIKYLRINLIGAHMLFDYQINPTLEGIGVNVFIEGNTTLFKSDLNLNWEFHAYENFELTDFYGLQNSLRLSAPISNGLSVTIGHLAVYSEQVDFERKRFNTTGLVGISYKRL